MNDKTHLSKEETLKRVGLYSKLGDERQFFDIAKLQKSYESRQQQLVQHRAQQDIYYSQGLEKGLPHPSYQTMIQQRELADQKMRTRLLAETKALYSKGHNLSKWLNKEVGNTKTIDKSLLPKSKNKTIQKGLRKYFNKPVSVAKHFNKQRTIDKERER